MTNEELVAIRTIMREEVGTMQTALRTEFNARFDGIDARFDGMEQRLKHLEYLVEPMKEHLILLRASLKELQSDVMQIKGEHKDILDILDEMSKRINELILGRPGLELKVDTIDMKVGLLEKRLVGTAAYEAEIQRLSRAIQALEKQLSNALVIIAERLETHEKTPINHAHPPHTVA